MSFVCIVSRPAVDDDDEEIPSDSDVEEKEEEEEDKPVAQKKLKLTEYPAVLAKTHKDFTTYR